MAQSPRKILSLIFALLVCALSVAAAPPDLVVVISVDQMRADYLQRFGPWLSDAGFRLFAKEGAVFEHAAYTHAATVTACGHATIGTGQDPRSHGIVGNGWFDRVAGKDVDCVEDPTVRMTAGKSDPASPRNLSARGLGDQLVESHPKSKVIGLALKDRAAILMAGPKANAAVWFDDALPGFVSSSYYRPLSTIAAFNRKVPSYLASHGTWEPSGLIPPPDLARTTWDPPQLRQFKSDPAGMGTGFPHPIASFEALTGSPFGDVMLLDFARAVIDSEKLGTRDGAPDLIYIGLSSLDLYTHSYGPDSMEVADGIVRLDRQLASFFADLRKRFGDRVAIVVTADHGVQSIPEVAADRGQRAGRVGFARPGRDAKTLRDLAPTRRDLEIAIARELGIDATPDTPLDKAFLRATTSANLYLNWDRIDALGIDPEKARQAAKRAVLPIRGVAGAWTSSELLATTPAKSETEREIRVSYRPDRSGDVVIALEPGFIWASGSRGANHGAPVEADQHVPLMLWGKGVRKGTYADAVSPSWLARSLATLLEIPADNYPNSVLPCIGVGAGARN